MDRGDTLLAQRMPMDPRVPNAFVDIICLVPDERNPTITRSYFKICLAPADRVLVAIISGSPVLVRDTIALAFGSLLAGDGQLQDIILAGERVLGVSEQNSMDDIVSKLDLLNLRQVIGVRALMGEVMSLEI